MTLVFRMNITAQGNNSNSPTETSMSYESFVIRLREDRDDSAIYRITSEESFQNYATHWKPFPSLDLFRIWFAALGNERFDLVAEINDELVGFASLFVLPDRQSHAGWFVLGVCEHSQNKGVGRKLLQSLIWIADLAYGLRRIQLTVYCNNTVAMKLYRKFGFEIEGRHKDFVRYANQFVDAYSMARVRADTVPPKSEIEIHDRLSEFINQMLPVGLTPQK